MSRPALGRLSSSTPGRELYEGKSSPCTACCRMLNSVFFCGWCSGSYSLTSVGPLSLVGANWRGHLQRDLRLGGAVARRDHAVGSEDRLRETGRRYDLGRRVRRLRFSRRAASTRLLGLRDATPGSPRVATPVDSYGCLRGRVQRRPQRTGHFPVAKAGP